jgi:hypothetical protein
MSKRVPVYLSEEEIKLMLDWRLWSTNDNPDHEKGKSIKLKERLESELETFEE